jgi:hypothetical protein
MRICGDRLQADDQNPTRLVERGLKWAVPGVAALGKEQDRSGIFREVAFFWRQQEIGRDEPACALEFSVAGVDTPSDSAIQQRRIGAGSQMSRTDRTDTKRAVIPTDADRAHLGELGLTGEGDFILVRHATVEGAFGFVRPTVSGNDGNTLTPTPWLDLRRVTGWRACFALILQ